MIFVLDIGNSTIKYALFSAKVLVHKMVFDTSRIISKPEVNNSITEFIDTCATNNVTIDGIAIASVIPSLTKLIVPLLTKTFRTQPLVITPTLNVGVIIKYNNPALLGADRFCNIVAAMVKYKQKTIVIDWGTATKFELVSTTQGYLGGIIAPGLAMMAEGLSEKTALLPLIRLEKPRSLLGNDTESCMQSGVVLGMVGLSVELARRIRMEYLTVNNIITTGGYAPLLTPLFNKHITAIHDPNLALEGARIIFERVHSR
ncbi:MAG: type III pantothenate kinase [Ignavibacteriae bacterium]|nr:type III pantothenate kinase [Ignavibacteriota bacterium]